MKQATTEYETLQQENNRLHQRIQDLEHIIDHLTHLLGLKQCQDKEWTNNSNVSTCCPSSPSSPNHMHEYRNKPHQNDNFLAKLTMLEQRVDTIISPDTNDPRKETLDVAVAIEQLRDMSAALSYAHNALIAERLRYQELFDQAPDGYLVTNMQGIIEDANEAAAAMLCISSRYLRNLPLYLFIPYDIRTQLQEQLVYLQSGTVQEITRSEMRIQPHKQPEIYVSLSVRVAYDAGNTPIGLRWILHDMTERKYAEEVLHQYKNIVSATPDAISLVDSSYTYRIINQAYLKHIGKQYHEVVGFSVAQVIGNNIFVTLIKEQFDCCLQGETIRFAEWFEFAGEGRRFIDVTYTPYRDQQGVITGVLVNRRDITDIKRTEDALHEHQMLLDAISNNAPAGLMVKDLQGNILLANNFLESLFQTDLTGKNQADLFPPEMLATWIAEDQQVLATREPIEVEERVQHGEDSYTYLINKFPLFDGDNNVFAIGSYGLDITKRKRAEEALRQSEHNYRTLAHNIPDGVVFLFDRDMRFQVAAGKQLAALGMSSEMLEGKTLSEAVPPDIATIDESFYRAILEGTAPPEIEQYYGDRVYRSQPVSLRNEHGDIVAGMIISQDITERTRMEHDLRDARDQAEAATRTRSEFLAHMSHELRTPLNTILGFSQLMAFKPGYAANDYEYLHIINRSGEHLLLLINNVLNLSGIETGQVEWYESSFDLYHLIANMEQMFTLSTQQKDITFTLTIAPDVPRTIVTDEMKLRQVLMNLLSNAVKFTKSGGVSLRVAYVDTMIGDESDATANDAICARLSFEVEDTGPGIAADELASLFDSFVQASTGRWKSESVGIGLALCRNYVQLMGGDMTVRSQVGQGSVFAFDITVSLGCPRLGTPQQPTHTIAGLVPNQPLYRILVADDHTESRQLLVSLLAPVGFEVDEASNGLEALALWEQWHPHIIFSNIRLPFLDGYDLARRIKATPQGKHTTLVAVTTSAFEEDCATIMAAGYDDYMLKPLHMGDIFEMIARYLGVSYQHVESETVTTEDQPDKMVTLPAESLAGLPANTVASLHYAATIGDMHLLSEIIEAIYVNDMLLATRLQELVETFRFDLIACASKRKA